MEDLLTTLSEPWAYRALIISSMIGIMYGVLGCFIVLRNMSLIGDALSHAILPGVFFSFVLLGYSTIGFFLGSVLAGLLTAILITWIQHHIQTKNDAAIGIVFTMMFSIGVIGISWLNNAQGVHLDLKDFLVGSIMGISDEDIALTVLVFVFTISSIAMFYRYLFATTFQPVIAKTMGISIKAVHYFLMVILSFAIVSGLKTIGVILVVALLIIPSSTALLLSERLNIILPISGFLGMISSILGLILAIIYNTPPGPAMVLVAACFYFIAGLFAPKKGLVVRLFDERKQRIKIIQEDILQNTLKYKGDDPLSVDFLAKKLGVKPRLISKIINTMRNEGLVDSKSTTIELTAKGKDKAHNLVRAHRLWETYQVTQMGLDKEQIHEEADITEHKLTPKILDDLDKKLGFPTTDPHGSPIPPKSKKLSHSLLYQNPNSRVKILKNQANDHVESELWEMGILPDSFVTIKKITGDRVILRYKQENIEIDANLAGQILVGR